MDTYQQIKQTFDRARKILIALPKNSRVDNAMAALALRSLLAANSKEVELVSANYLASQNLKFIPHTADIKPYLPSLKQLVISVKTHQTPIKEFSYDTTDESLEIFLEPERSVFDPKDVEIKKVDYKFDLIITLGVSSLESLGEIFQAAPDFFYTIPIVNIDFKPNNEHYGQINLVEMKKVAISEMVFDLFSEFNQEELINKEIATQLLTGVISQTNGLKSSQLTPQVLEKISSLIKYGVDVPEINKNLFHTKSLSMLKLWGRVLARLKEDKNLNLVWSLIPQADFTITTASFSDLPQIIDELISTYAQAKLILLLWQQPNNTVSGLLKTTYRHNALDLTNSLSPEGSSDLAQFSLPTSNLIEAEQEVIGLLSERLSKN